MMTISSYVQRVEDAWNRYDGQALAELLSFHDAHVKSAALQLESAESAVDGALESPMDELVAAHLKALRALANQDYTEAYNCQAFAVQSFCKLLSSQKDDNWPLPIMYVLCLDLRLLAAKVDKVMTGKSCKPGENVEKAAEHIMTCFRTCALDGKSSEEVTKRWGMLNVVNQLFKIYFRVNKLHLCKPLIRAIESSSLKERYPKSQLVTYKYFVGRKYMFDNSYRPAEEYLSYAFEHCHRQCRSNKRAILIYLVPVKMLLGHFPKMSLLQRYDLMQFAEVVSAVKQGNLLRLTQALEKNEKFFIQFGIFLILEKLKVITYRNLFKKVALLTKSHQIPIDSFLVALRMMQVKDIDQEETQCIIANLIYEGKIKGYISYQHQKLVVSKQNAFPALYTSAPAT